MEKSAESKPLVNPANKDFFADVQGPINVKGWKGQIIDKLKKHDLALDSLQVQNRTVNETVFKVATISDGNCKQLLTALQKHEKIMANLQESIDLLKRDITEIAEEVVEYIYC